MIEFLINKITENNYLLVISLIAAISTKIIFPFIKDWLKDKYDRRKKISIESEVIYNVNSSNGGFELVNDSTKQYSNLIYNEITVKSLNKETISSIILKNIKKEPNEISDIRYDGGLYKEQQKHLLIAYNNGNTKGETGDITIKISATKDGVSEDELETIISPSIYIEPGMVTGRYKIDLLNFKTIFENNKEFSALKIFFMDEKRNTIFKDSFLYNRETNQFESAVGAGPGPSIQEVPFFNLSNSKKKEEINCSQLIEETSNIYFTVFVDDDCKLYYKVVLKSKRKKIKSRKKHCIKIRIPKYKQERTSRYGCFYSLIKNYNPDLSDFEYSWEMVKELQSELVFNKYEAAEKYAKAKFDN